MATWVCGARGHSHKPCAFQTKKDIKACPKCGADLWPLCDLCLDAVPARHCGKCGTDFCASCDRLGHPCVPAGRYVEPARNTRRTTEETMANFNKVILMGNLTRDPELRYAGGGRDNNRDGGGAVCKFGMAVNRTWRNQAGEKQEEVCFVDLVAFGRLGENLNEYKRKGDAVMVEGRLHYDSWEDKESGKKRSKLEVVAENIQFVGGPPRDGDGGQREERGRQDDRGGGSRDDRGGGQQQGGNENRGGGRGGEVSFDDIPF